MPIQNNVTLLSSRNGSSETLGTSDAKKLYSTPVSKMMGTKLQSTASTIVLEDSTAKIKSDETLTAMKSEDSSMEEKSQPESSNSSVPISDEELYRTDHDEDFAPVVAIAGK